jgi:spoIIIJ-associated protein
MADSELSQPVDATGPTLEEAIDHGLAQLGLTRDDVIIEVLDEGSRGVLGLGTREAQVRLTPLRRPQPPAPERAARPPLGASTQEEDEYETKVARETLLDLLTRMHVNASVKTYRAEAFAPEESAPIVLDIEGPDLGVLIGRRGETLDALQYISRLIVSREIQRRANIVIDVEGYKSRREASLRKLAQRMADQARQQGRIVTLEPMPPNERRIIHIALRDDPTVKTESVGLGERRKVTIIPVGRQP